MLTVASYIESLYTQAFFGRGGMQNIYVLCLYIVFFMNAKKIF